MYSRCFFGVSCDVGSSNVPLDIPVDSDLHHFWGMCRNERSDDMNSWEDPLADELEDEDAGAETVALVELASSHLANRAYVAVTHLLEDVVQGVDEYSSVRPTRRLIALYALALYRLGESEAVTAGFDHLNVTVGGFADMEGGATAPGANEEREELQAAGVARDSVAEGTVEVLLSVLGTVDPTGGERRPMTVGRADMGGVPRTAASSRGAAASSARSVYDGRNLSSDPNIVSATASTGGVGANPRLGELRSLLEGAERTNRMNSHSWFVYGLVLKGQGARTAARDAFLRSVQREPLFWAPWAELAQLVDRRESGLLADLALPHHPMRLLFTLETLKWVGFNMDAVQLALALERDMPELGVTPAVVVGGAVALTNLREHWLAKEVFAAARAQWPMYLDGMDEYSNALYVHEDTSGLCQLARDAVLIDRYRPETCCIIGNYHSLCGDHVQAVLHFRRALRLNPRYGATWTLLGHELINLKQTRAAVSAYRSALAITPHDYRAWYGLAQVYEILSMPLYALYYFERAAELRPTDARMWTAMASCYESLSMWEGAARCYERAIVTVDREGTALPRVAKLYATRLGNQSKAAHYYVRLLSRLDREGSHGRDVVEALGFLANHEFHAGNKEACSAYCHRLLDYNCKERDDAQALLARMGEAV